METKITREQKIKELSCEYGSDNLSVRHHNIYMKRLKLELPFHNKNLKTFYDQYKNGDGTELKEKFWKTHSSSRLCFEFFSWLAYEKGVDDIVFEKKLPGIRWSPHVPNIDVYIQSANTVYFIESKFTEKGEALTELPDAYYMEKGEAVSTEGSPLKSFLKDRYYNTGFDQCVVKLCESIKSNLNKKSRPVWLDIPQEIKHTVGIYFEIIKNLNKYNGKNVVFYNLFFDFKDGNEEYSKYFFETVQGIMKEELKKKGFTGTYTYGYKTYQEVMDIIPERPAYGSNVIRQMHACTNKDIIRSFLDHHPIVW